MKNKWSTDAKLYRPNRNMKTRENATMHLLSHLHDDTKTILFMLFKSINNRVQFHNDLVLRCLELEFASGGFVLSLLPFDT